MLMREGKGLWEGLEGYWCLKVCEVGVGSGRWGGKGL